MSVRRSLVSCVFASDNFSGPSSFEESNYQPDTSHLEILISLLDICLQQCLACPAVLAHTRRVPVRVFASRIPAMPELLAQKMRLMPLACLQTADVDSSVEEQADVLLTRGKTKTDRRDIQSPRYAQPLLLHDLLRDWSRAGTFTKRTWIP